VLEERALQFERTDAVVARLEDVGDAADIMEVALGIDARFVAGPVVAALAGGLGLAEAVADGQAPSALHRVDHLGIERLPRRDQLGELLGFFAQILEDDHPPHGGGPHIVVTFWVRISSSSRAEREPQTSRWGPCAAGSRQHEASSNKMSHRFVQ
jgi:hypothetical protein